MIRSVCLVILLVASAASSPAVAQDFDLCAEQPGLCACNQLPACPDGSTPAGQSGFCSCARDPSCSALTSDWDCNFFAGFGWACECSFVGPVDPIDPTDPPLLPPDPFCSHVVCSDGSAATFDGFSCLCPQG